MPRRSCACAASPSASARLLANDGIDLDLARGEMLALLGENGAGKTTLMSILFGHYVADAGTVEVAGLAGALQPLRPGSPQAALAAGIGMVHQHFALADNLSVFDNIVLGSQPLWRPALRRRAARAKLAALIEASGLAVPLDAMVSSLSVGERQRVEILKALYRDARILILDEPTAVLTPQEAEGLFAVLRRLAAQGLAHRLHLAQAGRGAGDQPPRRGAARRPRGGRTADRRRRPRRCWPRPWSAAPIPETRERPAAPGAPVLELDGVTLRGAPAGRSARRRDVRAPGRRDARHRRRLRQRPGGAGRAGLGPGPARCRPGRPVRPPGAGRARRAAMVAAGVGRIPEDRHRDGVVGDMAVWENLALEDYRGRAAQRCGLMRRAALRDAGAAADRAPTTCAARGRRRATRLLSGGNIQKLILGRVLEPVARPDPGQPADPRPRCRRGGRGPRPAARAARGRGAGIAADLGGPRRAVRPVRSRSP